MRLSVIFGESPSPATVTMSGDLDVRAASEFGQVVMGLHDILGPEVRYDFSDVAVRDGAGRSAIEMVVHEFREHGPAVALPEA